MKKLTNLFPIILVGMLLSGCIDDGYYSSGGYYTDTGATNYHSDVTSGYNRDYHHRTAPSPDNGGGHYTTQSHPNQSGGYYSSQTRDETQTEVVTANP